MADYNFVQLDLQVDHGKKATQIKVLNIDCKDLQKFIQPLQQVQSDASKILKLYHQYLSEPRTASGLPYHMIKKFQQLKSSLGKATNLLQVQCRRFTNQISNRNFDKANEQQFFKKTLLSYDQKRLWMKNYILNNEKKVQLVEEEVLKNMEYKTHKYTQFLNTIDLERIQHSYHPKLQLMTCVCRTIRKNCDLRLKIRKKLSQQQHNYEPKEKNTEIDLTSELKMLKNTFTITSLFYNVQSKLDIKRRFLLNMTKILLKSKSRLIGKNKDIKIAIDKINQIIDQNNLEAMIVMDELKKEKGRGKEKITKTDYLIYLKEIHRQSQQRINHYGQYFQYSLVQSNQFHNAGKSKSQIKPYSFQNMSTCRKNISIVDFLERNQESRMRMMQQRSEKMTKANDDIKLEEEIKEIQKETLQLDEQEFKIEEPVKKLVSE